MIKNGVSIDRPVLPFLLSKHRTNILQTINCVKVGEIVSFNSTKRTAVVQIAFRRSLPVPLKDGTRIQSYPQLFDCPVVTLSGGGMGAAFPIAKGDECLVLFSDSNIDAWFQNGGQALPYDNRRHDISDGIALVGLNSLAKPLSTALITGEGGIADSAAKVSINASHKVTVKNGSTDLLTALTAIINAVKNLVTTNCVVGAPVTLNPASILVLENAKTLLGTLLY